MKLFVDDLRACPDGWEPARTNTEAIRMLATGRVDEITLDLNIFHDNVQSQESFLPVAYYLALMKNPPKTIRFHTADIAAGELMADIIGCKFDYWWSDQDGADCGF